MYNTEAVNPTTLGLLKQLQEKPYLQGFPLAGGTGLAIYLGHRKSEDIDLFSNRNFDVARLLENLQQDFEIDLLFTDKNTLKGIISGVNVDILAHRYPAIDTPVYAPYFLMSEKDIAAMKLNAISVSGQRSKDFIDIYFLLEKYSLEEMLGFYRKKYRQTNDSHVLKSLIYFDEVYLADWPILIRHPHLSWDEVKNEIETRVRQLLNE